MNPADGNAINVVKKIVSSQIWSMWNLIDVKFIRHVKL